MAGLGLGFDECPGLLEKLVDFLQSLVASVSLFFGVVGTGVDRHSGPENMERHRRIAEHVLVSPADRGQQAGLTGHGAALRCGQEVGDAVCPGDRDQFRVGVDRQPRLHLWRVGADFAGVDRGADRRDFHQAKRSGCGDDSRENVLSLEIDRVDFFELGHFLRRADGLDRVAIQKDETGCVSWAGHGVHNGVGQQGALGQPAWPSGKQSRCRNGENRDVCAFEIHVFVSTWFSWS